MTSPHRLTLILILLTANCLPALAAVIEVTSTSDQSSPDECTLKDALVAANTNSPTGGCPAGAGDDVILLPPDAVIVLNSVDNSVWPSEGPNGLPLITSGITIVGRGAELLRNPDYDCDLDKGPVDPDFRFFQVGTGGQVGRLTLRDLTLRNGCVFNGDFPYQRAGGAISLVNGTLELEQVSLLDNAALDHGGALRLGGSNATIHDSRLAGNRSMASGGAMYVIDSLVDLARSTVAGNSARTAGGGLFLSSGILNVIASTISANEAGRGGGIDVSNDDSSILAVLNSTLSANRAVGGGAIRTATTTVVQYSSFVDNEADFGSAIEINVNIGQRDVTVTNSLIAGGGPPVRCGGAVARLFAQGVNLVDDESCPGLEWISDAGLGPLADNGGPTLTHALLPGSPALARIENCAFFITARDQRDLPRPGTGSSHCDVGAYERQLPQVFADRFED